MHSRPIPRLPRARPRLSLSAPRDHFLTRPGPHLFPGWPRATIRDLPILLHLLLHHILPTRFAYPRNLRLYPLLSSVRHLPPIRLSSLRLNPSARRRSLALRLFIHLAV